MKLNTVAERQKYNIEKNKWTTCISGRTIDVVGFLISEGYTDFEEKTYKGGGHYGLPLHHYLECKKPNGDFVSDAKSEAYSILKERLDAAVDQMLNIKM